MGLDGLDAPDYTGVVTERYSGIRSSNTAVGVWRTCNQTTFWIIRLVLEASQTGWPGPGKSMLLFFFFFFLNVCPIDKVYWSTRRNLTIFKSEILLNSHRIYKVALRLFSLTIYLLHFTGRFCSSQSQPVDLSEGSRSPLTHLPVGLGLRSALVFAKILPPASMGWPLASCQGRRAAIWSPPAGGCLQKQPWCRPGLPPLAPASHDRLVTIRVLLLDQISVTRWTLGGELSFISKRLSNIWSKV